MATKLADFTVAVTDTIRVAMEKIDRNKHRVVIVVDSGKVVGTVSDGDIRRAFLHDMLPVAPVSRIMQLNPVTTTETDREQRQAVLRSARVTVLPVISADNTLIDVALAYEPFDVE